MPSEKVNPKFNKIVAEVRDALKGGGLLISASGPRNLPDPIDMKTGFWEGQGSKNARLLIHIKRDGEIWTAAFPKADDDGGFANLGSPNAELGDIAVQAVRIMVLLHGAEGFVRADDWEWFAFFVFEPPISNASTSALLKAYRVAKQTVTVRLKSGVDEEFKVREVILVAMPTEASVSVDSKTLSYEEATRVLGEFLDAARLDSTHQALAGEAVTPESADIGPGATEQE